MAWSYWKRHDEHSRLMDRLAEIARDMDRQDGRDPRERMERLHREQAHFRTRFGELYGSSETVWDDEHPLVDDEDGGQGPEDGHEGDRGAYYNAYFQI